MTKIVKINFILIFCPGQVFLQECPEPFGLSEFLMVALCMPQQLVASFKDVTDARDLA